MRTATGYFFMTINFTKLALSNQSLVALLKQRGLNIENQADAVHKLQTVGYYRFSAYFQPFIKTNQGQNKFIHNISFDDLWNLYNFDSELRSLMVEALEKIEIAFRAAINDHMCIKYQPNWYQDPTCFRTKYYHDEFLAKVQVICHKQEELFLRHYYAKYNNPKDPPSWMIMQCLTFGTCSSLFKNIKSFADLKVISNLFKHHPRIIGSWMDALRYTRNICAHHARLWNRWFLSQPIHPKQHWPIATIPCSFHEQVLIILQLLACLEQKELWQDKLHALFARHPKVPYALMGFNSKWRLDPIWQMAS